MIAMICFQALVIILLYSIYFLSFMGPFSPMKELGNSHCVPLL